MDYVILDVGQGGMGPRAWCHAARLAHRVNVTRRMVHASAVHMTELAACVIKVYNIAYCILTPVLFGYESGVPHPIFDGYG